MHGKARAAKFFAEVFRGQEIPDEPRQESSSVQLCGRTAVKGELRHPKLSNSVFDEASMSTVPVKLPVGLNARRILLLDHKTSEIQRIGVRLPLK